MTTRLNQRGLKTDPAAVFAIAISIWRACHNCAGRDETLNLSDSYGGIDGLMREVMRIAVLFEAWSCAHVDFDELDEVWPYLLEDRFGRGCVSILAPDRLLDFDERDCQRIAAKLRLALR